MSIGSADFPGGRSPNRIVLFYHDAEISAEYTKIGTLEATEEFVAAVEENPVPEAQPGDAAFYCAPVNSI